jgi:hypothetical protein
VGVEIVRSKSSSASVEIGDVAIGSIARRYGPPPSIVEETGGSIMPVGVDRNRLSTNQKSIPEINGALLYVEEVHCSYVCFLRQKQRFGIGARTGKQSKQHDFVKKSQILYVVSHIWLDTRAYSG